MTSLCGGGASGAKPNLADNMVLASGALGLLALYPALSWLDAIAIPLGVLAYELPTLCASDPPAMPSFTQAELLAAATGFRGTDYDSFVSKFGDLLTNLAWDQFCHCTSGTYTPATQPSNPGGVQILPGGNGRIPCQTFQTDVIAATSTRTHVFGPFSMYSNASFTAFTTNTEGVGGNTFLRFEVWAGTTLNFSDAAFVGPSLDAGRNQTATHTASPFGVIGGRYYWVVAWDNGSTPDGSGFMNINVYCNGNAPGSPCGGCPDTAQILTDLTELIERATKIQLSVAPESFTHGTAHAGLSGAGALSISGINGVRVDVTTLPSPYGLEGTSPPVHFGLGYITFGTVDGFPSAFRLERNPQIVLPCFAAGYTDLDYDLSPGVIVTITELSAVAT